MKLALISLQKEAERVPPYGLVCLATYLQNICEVKIFDKNFDEDIEKKVLEFKPDIIGLSAMTVNYEAATAFAKHMKANSYDGPLIIGGVHISTLPTSFRKCFDVGVIGEGEATIKELINNFYGGKFHNLSLIKSIIYWDGDEIKHTPLREPLALDTLPIPDFKFVSPRYFEKADIPSLSKAGIRGYIMSSRGCCYNCKFCSTTHFWKKMRFHSPEWTAKEIKKQIENQHADYFYVLDDLFAISPDRLYKLKAAFEKEDILDKIIGFDSTARANLLSEELCNAMKAIKIKVLNLGLESGSPTILKYLKNNGVTIEQNRNAIVMARKHNFTITGSLMLGVPGETLEDMKKTIEFIDFCHKNGAKHIWLFSGVPFPDTSFWDIAKQRGKVSDDMNFDLLTLHQTERPLLLDDNISTEDFQKVFKEAQRKLRNMRIKLVLEFGLKNPITASQMILKEPKYWISRLYKQLAKQ